MGLRISDLPASAAAVRAMQFEVNNAGTSERLTLAQMFALSTGAVVASTPLLDMAQTWNNAAVAFTGWKLNVTAAASAAGSLLMDLQVGGASKFAVDPASVLYVNSLNGSAGAYSGIHISVSESGTSPVVSLGYHGSAGSGVSIRSYAAFAFSSVGHTSEFGFCDTFLLRDAANTLALRNGTIAQAFNLYSTYTDNSNYSRLSIMANGNEFSLGCVNAGTGPAKDLSFIAGAGHAIYFGTDATPYRMFLTAAGHLMFGTDNSFDIGSSGANRPRNIYAANKVQGKLTTEAAAVAETITPDKTLTLYDSTGTAYKVPCVAA